MTEFLLADKLAGWFICDNAVNAERGHLLVEKRRDGQWYDTELDARLEAKEIVPLDVVTKRYVIIEDEEYRVFVPDPGECERVGIPVRRRRARMDLYAVEIAGRPVVIGSEPGLSAYLEHGVEQVPGGDFVPALGGGLQGSEDVSNPGRPVWDGEPSSPHFRKATDAEIDLWQSGLRQAQERTKKEVNGVGWLVFLIPLRKLPPTAP